MTPFTPEAPSKKIAFVLETYDYPAVRKSETLNPENVALLETISDGLDAHVLFAVEDPTLAGRAKGKIGIRRIRKEQGRLLDEISHIKPDVVMCFGPTAVASVFDHGSLTSEKLFRKAHFPLGDDGPEVYVTVGLSATRWKAGLQKWLKWDVEAAVNGWGETEWGNYDLILPGSNFWEKLPPYEIACMGTTSGPKVIGFDLETYPGIDPWHPDARIRMAVISDQVGRAWIIQATADSKFPKWLYRLLEQEDLTKAGSNIKFDYLWMRRFGCRVVNMWDTSTHEHIIDESNPRKDLKNLTFMYVKKLADYSRGHRELVEARGGKKHGWANILDHEMYQYAGGDGEASIGAALGQMPKIKDGLSRPAHLYRRVYATLAEMEHNGTLVDLDVTRELDKIYGEKLVGLRQQIVEVLGPVNPNSPTALAKALKEAIPDINLKLREWKRVLSDDEDEEITTKRGVLLREQHKHPVIKTVLEFRSYRTRHSTFIKGILEKYAIQHSGGFYVHSSYHTDRVETFRLSSSHPNGQNITRDDPVPKLSIKRQFVSRFRIRCACAGSNSTATDFKCPDCKGKKYIKGEIMEADQSQIEIRFAAWISQDKAMLKAIASGGDIHTAMAALMLDKKEADVTEEERHKCKKETFLILYGGGAYLLAQDLQIPLRQAIKLIKEYFETFSGLKDYIDKAHSDVHRRLSVTTPFGFTRRFIEPEQWGSSEGYSIERQAFNTVIQNGAACITYCAMVWFQEELERRGYKSLLTRQVHDSLVVDVYPGERQEIAALLKRAMEVEATRIASEDYNVTLDVALKCDVKVGPSWAETEKLEVNYDSYAPRLSA